MSTKILLKESLEYKHYRINLYVMLALYFGLLIVTFPLTLMTPSEDSSGNFLGLLIVFVCISPIILPFVFFYLYRMNALLTKLHLLTFHETILDTPHSAILLRTMYFEVTFIVDNQKIKRNTRAIFSTHAFGIAPLLEEYINKKILIAYNHHNDSVIIIKPI